MTHICTVTLCVIVLPPVCSHGISEDNKIRKSRVNNKPYINNLLSCYMHASLSLAKVKVSYRVIQIYLAMTMTVELMPISAPTYGRSFNLLNSSQHCQATFKQHLLNNLQKIFSLDLLVCLPSFETVCTLF